MIKSYPESATPKIFHLQQRANLSKLSSLLTPVEANGNSPLRLLS
nr:hypothetical protein [Okeania sp. SIO2F4]